MPKAYFDEHPAGCSAALIRGGASLVARRALAGLRLLTVAIALAGASVPVMADEKLARSRNCFACHQIETKLVGPAWREVAIRYARDPEAELRLARKIREGGAGVWGVIAMAPNPAVTESDARALARWVLSLRPPG